MSNDDVEDGGWRDFRIGSFRHPPVRLRGVDDLWTRPPVSKNTSWTFVAQEEGGDADRDAGADGNGMMEKRTQVELAHFLEFSPVVLHEGAGAGTSGDLTVQRAE